MERNEVITLVQIKFTKNELFQDVKKEIHSEIFAERKSIGQREFFNAGQTGIKPSCCFVVDLYDYNNASFLIYEGKRYSIYRTFEKGSDIELYVEGRVGND